MKNYAIILASGTGSRAGLNIPKQFYKINGKSVLEYSIEAFENNKFIDSIIVVSNPEFIDITESILNYRKFKKVKYILPGGKTRQESSFIALKSIDKDNINVLIHDAVRPFVSQEIINNCVLALKKYQAINVAVESSDTIIQVNSNNLITCVPERKSLRRCQTPQCFNINVIKLAHEKAQNDDYNSATDDCSLVLKYKLAPIFVVNGSENNIKITYNSDIEIAEKIAKKGL